jgi:ribonuclease BN (tRNA processing enzyme)
VTDRLTTNPELRNGPAAGRHGLSLTVLGCDGSWTGPGGAGSGYLVSSGRTHLVIDLGPGTFANLQHHLDPAAIDAVFLSHHHPDHWTDLNALATHARFVLGRRGIPVVAPAGLAERSGLEGSPSLEWRAVGTGDSMQLGGLRLTFSRTDHSFETLAVRVDGADRSLGYSADTGPGWSLGELGSGLDLVLCEATYTSDHEGTADHLSARQAGQQARAAGAGRLAITHRWPTIEAHAVATEAAATFGRPVEQAVIGKEFVL